MNNNKKSTDPRDQYSIFGNQQVYERLVCDYEKVFSSDFQKSTRGRPCKLLWYQHVQTFFLRYRQDLTLRCLAQRYQVSKSLIANIISRVEKFILDHYSHDKITGDSRDKITAEQITQKEITKKAITGEENARAQVAGRALLGRRSMLIVIIMITILLMELIFARQSMFIIKICILVNIKPVAITSKL